MEVGEFSPKGGGWETGGGRGHPSLHTMLWAPTTMIINIYCTSTQVAGGLVSLSLWTLYDADLECFSPTDGDPEILGVLRFFYTTFSFQRTRAVCEDGGERGWSNTLGWLRRGYTQTASQQLMGPNETRRSGFSRKEKKTVRSPEADDLMLYCLDLGPNSASPVFSAKQSVW